MIKPLNLLDLPDCIIEKVMSYVSYDEIAMTRIVCRKFNAINKRILNRGFYKAQNNNQHWIRRIRAHLLRYGVERDDHPLSDRLSALMHFDAKLSVLSSTYEKHMKNGSACFIPGRIIDEYYRLIRLIFSDNEPLRRKTYDISLITSMARDHFDQCIEPHIKIPHGTSSFDSLFFNIKSLRAPTSAQSTPQRASISAQSTPQRAAISAQITPQQQPSCASRVVKKRMKSKLSTLLKMYKNQSKMMMTQTRQIGRMMKFMREQRTTLNSMKQRLDDSEMNTSKDSTAN